MLKTIHFLFKTLMLSLMASLSHATADVAGHVIMVRGDVIAKNAEGVSANLNAAQKFSHPIPSLPAPTVAHKFVLLITPCWR